MAKTWTRSEIRALVRKLTGRRSTSQMSDTAINEAINDFYMNHFPLFVHASEFKGWYQKETAPSDSGEYDIPESMLLLTKPCYIDGNPISYEQNETDFFGKYPRVKSGNTAYPVTDASLAAGSSDSTAVANSAFKYRIDQYAYSKAAAETALSGNNVPQNKYGAWRLEINSSGTISVVEADGNSSGYDSPAEAIDNLDPEESEKAPLGFVTAIKSDGVFQPGTTSIDGTDTAVTVTFTDGFHSDRNEPCDVLVSGDKFYLRPEPDDIYLLEAKCKQKPSELTSDSSTPTDVRWGSAIAYGTAILILTDNDEEVSASITTAYEGYIKSINREYITQLSKNTRVKPKW